uniref:RHD domain-containing protein n=1 Tax=Gadus morhua TaxID=8049 RepID=A0A8C4Z0F1_GADMO
PTRALMVALVLQLLMNLNYDYIPPVDIKTEPYIPENAHGPYIQIIEEPKQRGFRFRYECEGPSHGGLPGASSERNRRTYPTVKVNNYVGHARVEVQLVTHSDPARVHAHSLVGRQCTENGTCTLDVGPNDLTASFSNLGILHVTKKGVMEVLTRRLRDERRQQKGLHHLFSDAEDSSMVKEAKELGKVMDLNIVRLKFTAYLQDSNGGFTRALKPVVSNPIYDSKSPNASNLKISRMDKTCGSVFGGDEIFLLCDKVQKDDIEIRFYEEDEEGAWEAFGDFSPTDVHKQYAIVFRTPPYHSMEIQGSVPVFLQLKRKKAGDSSEPKIFTYVPHVHDKEEVQRKKLKPLSHYEPWRGGGGAGGGGGGGAGGGQGGGRGGAGDFGGGGAYQHMNGGGGGGAGGGGGSFNSYRGSFNSYGGGNQMSGSAPQTVVAQQQTTDQTDGQSSPLQQQLLQLGNYTGSRPPAQALLQYCSSGDPRVLLALQRHLCGVQDHNGDTPLHLAIIHQQSGVVHQLIHTLLSSHQNHVLNTPNQLRQTPLHLAVLSGQVRLVEALLRAGADPGQGDLEGRSPLHLAALAADEALLRPLLAHLGESHAHLVNMADYHGLHPLHLSVRRGGERCLRLLVGGGAKINAGEQKSGSSALHLAVRDNLFKVACYLITELKADVNAATFGGNTALHLAASQGSPTLCSMLIAAGADKNLENDEPLSFSSSSSSDEDEDQEEDQPITAQHRGPKATSQPITTRKRPSPGHTPLQLATCQKVKKLLDSRHSPRTGRHSNKKIKCKPQRGVLDEETLSSLLGVLRVGEVPWRALAERLGMMTLAHLYQDSPSPCQHLLHSYQLGGGAVEGLVGALEGLGLTEGVRVLRQAQLHQEKHTADATVDSGFGSQPMEEAVEEPPVANQ